MKLKTQTIAALVAAAFSCSALAAVTADEAKQLGGTLTEFGSEKAGNKEGTIPAYDPTPLQPPAGWDRNTQGYPDIWHEKPLFSITAQNAAQYADKLDATIELFKKYPNYRMDIYPSHRVVRYPKYMLENSVKNATACKGEDDELKLTGCYGGLPFPIPKTGRQEMWNHELTYYSYAFATNDLGTWVTPQSGVAVLQTNLHIDGVYPIYNPETASSLLTPQELFYKARVDFIGPARHVGEKLVLIYSIDTLGFGTRVWSYIPGQRRVKLAPDLEYDTPSPASGGSSVMDEQQGFLGALDRFDFKLIGKKEKYIMYNNFNLTDPRVCPDSKVVNFKNFPNPDCIRWELHRVWKVEATLKPGFRHIYPKRVFYWDEDTHGAGAGENYDAAGKLYRLNGTVPYVFYEGGYDAQSTVQMDLQTGTWAFSGTMGTPGGAWYPEKPRNDLYFSPETLAGEGIR